MKRYILRLGAIFLLLGLGFVALNSEKTLTKEEAIRSIMIPEKTATEKRVYNTYNFTKIKLKNGFTYKLFQDIYINDLANNENVKIYFDLSNVSSSRLKNSIKSMINLYNSLRGSSHRFTLTYNKPSSGKYYTNVVTQGKNNYLCDDSGWSYACANSSVLKINKKTASANTNLQKRVLFHEFLHVFGIDHVKQGTAGSSMDPAVDDSNRPFSYKHYPYDVAAWKMLNSPNISHTSKKGNTVTTNTYFLNVYPVKKTVKYKNKYKNIRYYYYSSRIRINQTYNSKGKINLKVNYYRNGKRSSYYSYYPNGRVNEAITYMLNGIRTTKKNYYDNGKLKQFIDYAASGKYEELKNYNKYGKLLNDAEYYSNGVMESNEYFYDNGNIKEELDYNTSAILIEDMKYYMTGFRKEVTHYDENGKLKQRITYDENGDKVTDNQY